MMDYCTVKEIAIAWGVSSRMVSLYCQEKRVEGAIKKGNLWLIPNDARKPLDLRINNGKRINNEGNNDGQTV